MQGRGETSPSGSIGRAHSLGSSGECAAESLGALIFVTRRCWLSLMLIFEAICRQAEF